MAMMKKTNRTFSVYLKKGNRNIDELLGEHNLLSGGYVIHNRHYLGRYGKFLRLLRDLRHRPLTAEKRAYLTKEYTRGMESAKFWATFPQKADDLSPIEKKRLQANLNCKYRQKIDGGIEKNYLLLAEKRVRE